MRPTAAGVILDASALLALPRSIYAKTIVEFSAREQRRLVIAATSLYVAGIRGAQVTDFDADAFTVIPLGQSIVPGVIMVARTAAAPIGIDVAHVAWEAQLTGYPVLTDDPGPYAHLTVPLDIETI